MIKEIAGLFADARDGLLANSRKAVAAVLVTGATFGAAAPAHAGEGDKVKYTPMKVETRSSHVDQKAHDDAMRRNPQYQAIEKARLDATIKRMQSNLTVTPKKEAPVQGMRNGK